MLDYTEGWMWFVSGLALTVAFAALVVAIAFGAGRAGRGGRRHGRSAR
jgi:hypothetical protein